MSILRDIIRKKPTVLIEKMQDFVFKRQQLLLEGKADSLEEVMKDLRLSEAHFKQAIAQYSARGKRSRTGNKFHPSQIAGCMRATWFDMMKAPANCISDKVSIARSMAIFGTGDAVHLRLQNLLERMGVLKEREVPLEDKDLNIEGHADGLIDVGFKAILEIKSINDHGFRSLIAPKDAHREQANIYMHCLKIPKAVFIYENKNTQEWREYVMNFDTALFKKQKQRIVKIEEAVASDKIPEKDGNDFSCRWCAFSAVCNNPSLWKSGVKKQTVTVKKRKSVALFMRK